MADTKNPSNKVFDITSSSKATPTSRPLIVGHGPMMQDPTIVNEDDSSEAEKVEVKTLSAKHQIKIKPLDDFSGELKSDDAAKNEPEKAQETIAANTGVPADHQPPTSISNAEQDKSGEVPAPVPGQPAPEPREAAKSTESKQADIDSANEQKKQEEEAAVAALEHSKHISELVASQQYFLPINQVEKKRNQRVVFLGAVLCVILAIAWVDVALDAGIISNSFHLPHTHFFALKP